MKWLLSSGAMTLPLCGNERRARRRCAEDVHATLCDNVDTRSALEALRIMVVEANTYLEAR